MPAPATLPALANSAEDGEKKEKSKGKKKRKASDNEPPTKKGKHVKELETPNKKDGGREPAKKDHGKAKSPKD